MPTTRPLFLANAIRIAQPSRSRAALAHPVRSAPCAFTRMRDVYAVPAPSPWNHGKPASNTTSRASKPAASPLCRHRAAIPAIELAEIVHSDLSIFVSYIDSIACGR